MRPALVRQGDPAHLELAAAPNTYHETKAIWGAVRRCDMYDRFSSFDSTKGVFVSAGTATHNKDLGSHTWVAARYEC